MKVITEGWMMIGPDSKNGKSHLGGEWLGWRIHANDPSNEDVKYKPVTIIEGGDPITPELVERLKDACRFLAPESQEEHEQNVTKKANAYFAVSDVLKAITRGPNV